MSRPAEDAPFASGRLGTWNSLLTGDLTNPERTRRWLARFVGLAGLALVAVTWRLWLPRTDFPQVPFAGWFVGAPPWLDWTGLAALLAGYAGLLIAAQSPRLLRIACLVLTAAIALMALLNQHRFQPWAYQFGLTTVVLALAPARQALGLLRVLTISLYFHSALSKLDHSFLTTHGQQFFLALLQSVGLSGERFPEGVRQFGAATFPAGELAVAIALLVPRTRRIGVVGAVLMHSLLLLALGPWGLGHRPGVLIWNAYFIAQAVLLFGNSRRAPAIAADAVRTCRSRGVLRRRTAEAIIVAAVLLPLLEPFGLFDHWPAWALYASRPERVHVYVTEDARDRLPEEIRKHVAEPRPFERWLRVGLERWSLEALSAPLYPQGRFQIGTALALAERHELGNEIRVVVLGPAHRLTGKRTTTEFIGLPALRRAAFGFTLNAKPRRE